MLLGMFGRNMHMNLQIILLENDTNFPISDVSQVQETLFNMSCGVEKLGIRWWLNRLTNVFLHFSAGFFIYLLFCPVLNNDRALHIHPGLSVITENILI